MIGHSQVRGVWIVEHCRLSFAIVGLVLMAVSSSPRASALSGQEVLPPDWIYVVSDQADYYTPGCDAISVFDSTGSAVYRGEQLVSPGRLAVSHDGRSAYAISTNSGPFLQSVLFDGARWSTRRYPRPWSEYDKRLLQGAPSYVSRQGWLYLSMRRSLGRFVAPGLADPGLLQPLAESGPLTVGAIVESPATSEIIVADVDAWLVRRLDPVTLASSDTPGPFEAVLGGRRDELVRRLSATLSPSGRWLVLSAGSKPSVTLIDLVNDTSHILATPGLAESWGVSFDYSSGGRLLAVHGRAAVAVYRFQPGSLVPLAVEEVPPPSPGYWKPAEQARFGSLAWFVGGDGIVANIGTREEFRLLRYDEQAPDVLTPMLDIDPCIPHRVPHRMLGFDVFTLNNARVIPSPTATATTEATPTATRTPTSSANPRPSSTTTTEPAPSRTPAVVAGPVYLPVTMWERCDSDQQRVDVVLVVDASTSMLEETIAGRTKLAAAQEAAGLFLRMLRLDTGDQASIVAFNSDANVLQVLTQSENLLAAALNSIQVRRFTRIDRGIEVAASELNDARRIARNAPVLILLTDGKANPVGVEVAERHAATAKAAGVTLFTIGLGDEPEVESLRRMASRSNYYYDTPSAEDLAEVYRSIAVQLPCSPVQFWGRR